MTDEAKMKKKVPYEKPTLYDYGTLNDITKTVGNHGAKDNPSGMHRVSSVLAYSGSPLNPLRDVPAGKSPYSGCCNGLVGSLLSAHQTEGQASDPSPPMDLANMAPPGGESTL
jgi:hypothetical protein